MAAREGIAKVQWGRERGFSDQGGPGVRVQRGRDRIEGAAREGAVREESGEKWCESEFFFVEM